MVQRSRDVKVTHSSVQVPEELEKAIGTMTRKERSIVYISRSYCVASPIGYDLNIPAEAEELEFEVELVQLIQVDYTRSYYLSMHYLLMLLLEVLNFLFFVHFPVLSSNVLCFNSSVDDRTVHFLIILPICSWRQTL